MFTLSKRERLSGRKNFSYIFENGKTIRRDCVTVRFRIHTDPQNPVFRFAVAVPKKFMKKAHDRNYIKRLFRENLRLMKSGFTSDSVKKIDCLFIYNSSELPDYQTIESICNDLTLQLIRKIN
jgi:ribonuclease P protein component